MPYITKRKADYQLGQFRKRNRRQNLKARRLSKRPPGTVNTGLNVAIPPKYMNPRIGGPFGQVFETELVYTTQVQLDPGSGGSASMVFSANGMYDPEVALGGHQPHGFNELTALFANYQVLSSACEATLFPKSEAYTWPATISGSQGSFVVPQLLLGSILAIGVRDTSTQFTGSSVQATTLMERPGLVTKCVGSYQNPTKVKATFSVSKFYGKSKVVQDDTLHGTGSSDPSDGVYYHVILAPPEASGMNLPPQNVFIRIKYRARFFNPINLASS